MYSFPSRQGVDGFFVVAVESGIASTYEKFIFFERGPVEKFPELPELPAGSALAVAVQTCGLESRDPTTA